jgi:hypothetical protein
MLRSFRFPAAVALGGWLLASAALAADESADFGSVRLIRSITPGPQNQVALVAYGAGVRKCADRIDLVTNFLTQNTQSSALAFLPDRDADNNMFSVSLEVKAENTPRAYASATFSPNTTVGCASEYETVQYWGESCTAVAAKTFKGATPTGTIGTDISILSIGPAARVFMMRATANACVTIKKEIVK